MDLPVGHPLARSGAGQFWTRVFPLQNILLYILSFMFVYQEINSISTPLERLVYNSFCVFSFLVLFPPFLLRLLLFVLLCFLFSAFVLLCFSVCLLFASLLCSFLVRRLMGAAEFECSLCFKKVKPVFFVPVLSLLYLFPSIVLLSLHHGGL